MNEINKITSDFSRTYLINGVNVSTDDYLVAQDRLKNIIHTPVNSSYNPTSGLIADLSNSLWGLISNQSGLELEQEASTQLELSLRKDLKANQQIKIFAHSQGSIILRNVLVKLADCGISLNSIKVFTFGAANYLWPKNLQVYSFTNRSDYLARSLDNLNQQYAYYVLSPWEKIQKFLGLQSDRNELEYKGSLIINKKIENPLKAHEWDSYLDNFNIINPKTNFRKRF